jgi:hypothetical protein
MLNVSYTFLLFSVLQIFCICKPLLPYFSPLYEHFAYFC